jgi:hypothetical protein
LFESSCLDEPNVLEVTEDWSDIRNVDKPVVIEDRQLGLLATAALALAEQAPFERRGEGEVSVAIAALGELPEPLTKDITSLAERFARLMGVSTIRVRLEAICSNACRKVHSDYTDVRLITTYAGPGTDYLPHGAEISEALLLRMNAGEIGLFKGRTFSEGHAPCFHRSPPVGDTGEKRLVLVIDTPLDPRLIG